MTLRNFLYLLVLFTCVYAPSMAQEDCSFTLSRAQKSYDLGVIENIPQMLSSCLDKGFTSEENMQAYKLIILSYLFNNDKESAEKMMLTFLRKYPEYEIQNTDPGEFIQLFKTYRTLPIASIGISLGTNFNYPRVIMYHGTPDLETSKGSYASAGLNFQGGISYRQYIMDKMDINLDILYTQHNYQFTNSNISGNSSIDFTETQTYLEFPLTAIYTPYSFNKFSTYLRGGLSTELLLDATAQASRTSNDQTYKTATGPSFTVKNLRETLHFSGIIGAGVCYNLKKSYLMLDVRYNLGFSNHVKKSARNTNSEMWSFYYYDENEFSVSDLRITLGFFYKFYKPQKR